MYKSYDPKEIPTSQLHEYLLSTIAPRPIAWASTIDANGKVNLAPFSFFNVFGSNPPTLIFSPARRVRDNTTKHTLENAMATKEVVINIASYDLVGQMMLSSAEFEDDVNEFEAANLTPEPSLKVRPPRVKESPAQFECIVKDIIATGDQGGAGNLVICEIVHVHLREDIFDGEKIDPRKVDNVARMGYLYYTRAAEGLFELPNPKGKTGLGFDRLPDFIKSSHTLTGNELARLASISYIPGNDEVTMVETSTGMADILSKYGNSKIEDIWKAAWFRAAFLFFKWIKFS
ncbi:MAG: flavin reductase family protein [Sphingobacteriales bacterium]|nr:MAG: flavin reductase family protein [Sphingobacteriales bacterium]